MPANQDKTVLVIDDSEDNRILATHYLKREGYTVTEAGDGAAALMLLRSRPIPDVIVLDLRMPVVDGWEFLAIQQTEERIALIPVVIYSCEYQTAAPPFLPSNVAAYVPKIGQPAELLAAVQLALDDHQVPVHRVSERSLHP